MKKILMIILSSISILNAQTTSYKASSVQANDVKYSIYSSKYESGKSSLIAFVKSNNFTTINQHESDELYHFEFSIWQADLNKVDSFCNSLGYLFSKNLNTYNNETKLKDYKIEISSLENKKLAYEKMYAKMELDKSPDTYTHWEKIRAIETQIFDLQKEIEKIESIKNIYVIKLDLHEDATTTSNDNVNFIHMPGIEYSYLFIENPKAGLSYASYQGVYLKYLFTKGKSYFSLGAHKANNQISSDSTAYSEMFSFIFGQDWYSRHLGRGKNRFMNLYIGYQAGYSIAYNNQKSLGIPFVSPSTGIELFKNKYILFDTNINYYVPLTDANKNLRGWKVGASINFTF